MRTRALLLFPAGVILLASFPLHAVPVHQWSKSFSDPTRHPYGLASYSAAADGLGNAVVTGYFAGTLDFGGGPISSVGSRDIFVARFDASGNHTWSRGFGDVGDEEGSSIATDGSGNVVVTGSFHGTVDFGGGPLTSAGGYDIFVAKFDANGNHLWSRRFGDPDFQGGLSVAADDSNNLVVTGQFMGTVDFGGGPLASAGDTDIYVVEFDANGNHLWSKRFGNTDLQSGRSVAWDGSGKAVVTGWFRGTLNFGGSPLTGAGLSNTFVVKFDGDGSHLWSKGFENSDNQSVAVDASGNIILTGGFGGTVDFGGGPLTAGANDIFVVKFDVDGNHLWSQRFGDADTQSSLSVAVDGASNVIVTGYFSGSVDFGGGPLTSAGEYDIFVAKLDANGNHLWSGGFGDIRPQIGWSVAANASGNIILTGGFAGTVDFGGGALTADDGAIFVVKFVEGPVPVLITSFEAKTREQTVEVKWDVWSDEAIESFTLYRRDDARPQAIVIAEGPFDPTTRSYVDASVEPGRTYHYELFIHTQGGDDFRSPVATVTVPRFEATLGQNFPNPFKPATTIEYTLTERSNTVVGIYDAAGRLVVRLDEGERDAGTHQVEWDGRDAGGRLVGSGVYFYRLEGAPRVAPKKMVLVR